MFQNKDLDQTETPVVENNGMSKEYSLPSKLTLFLKALQARMYMT